jgi:hypothetical protein
MAWRVFVRTRQDVFMGPRLDTIRTTQKPP